MVNEEGSINQAIRMMCEANVGVLNKGFLCQSLGAISQRAPLCVAEDCPVEDVLGVLRTNKVGCVLVVNHSGKLSGIFSERDFVLKVAHDFERVRRSPIAEYMTRDPTTQSMDCSVAFALNLMSNGGFRHIPIVDGEGVPVGAISVKDVIDYVVDSFTQDLLNFETT